MTQIFLCPLCKRQHAFDELSDDLRELHCTDNETSSLRQLSGYENNSMHSNEAWNFNKFSTKSKGFTNNAILRGIKLHKEDLRGIKNW
jgi:hypothetical protein